MPNDQYSGRTTADFSRSRGQEKHPFWVNFERGGPGFAGEPPRPNRSKEVCGEKFAKNFRIFGILDFILKFQGIPQPRFHRSRRSCKKAVGSSKNANVHSDELMRRRSNNGFKE